MFRGFRAASGPRGRIEYQFFWLTRRPIRAMFDARRRSLAFPALFPGIDSESATALAAIVASRRRRDQPDHKRLDGRRARLSTAMRKGDFSLAVEIRGVNHDYAVRQALNLINELFLALHEARPEYLAERFGVSTE